MKIVITADVHFGIKSRLSDCIWATKVIREYTHRNEIDTVLILGDLFHDRVSLNIEVLSNVYNFFKETKENYKIIRVSKSQRYFYL